MFATVILLLYMYVRILTDFLSKHFRDAEGVFRRAITCKCNDEAKILIRKNTKKQNMKKPAVNTAAADETEYASDIDDMMN